MLLMNFPAGVTGNQKLTAFEQGNKEEHSAMLETRIRFDVRKSLCSYVPVRLIFNFPAGKIRYLPARLYHLMLKTQSSVT